MGQIDTVVFDIGNVLVDFCWKDAFDNMNLPQDIWDRLYKATVGNQMWNEFDRGILSEEEIVDGFIKNDPEIKDVILDFMENHYHEICKQYDYAHEWIDTLKSHGYKIYFLSNFSEKGFDVLKDELNFVEKGDGAIISYRVKQIKPNRDIYDTLVATYGINPENAVFIDDTFVNIEAAKEIGINTIHFQNREQVLRELEELGVK